MSATLDRAGDVGCCCLCGAAHEWCLCPACFATYAPDGLLPAWLRSLQREAQRITARDRRSKRGGNNRGLGVSFAPLGADW